MKDTTIRDLKAAKKEHQDLLEMSVVDLALTTEGEASPASPTAEFKRRLLEARIAQLIADSGKESAEKMVRLTRAYVVATWVLAVLTFVIAAGTIIQLFTPHQR